MKLLSAKFENFRLLRDLSIEFSTDHDKKLTVFRAENETGKTTLLNALQWGLYGDDALPGKGNDYRLHPIDWHESDGARVQITVTIEFELTKHRKTASGIIETRKRYRIVRTATESIDEANWQKGPSSMILFQLSDNGAVKMEAPESFINDELPPELREVFFTDGDRALSFIEADIAASTKRKRVQDAIRSLLGLGVIDDAMRHVRQAASDVNKKAKLLEGNEELTTIANKLDQIENEITQKEEDLEAANEQFSAFDLKFSEIDRKIAAALQKGDKEALQKDHSAAKRHLKGLDDQIMAENKNHASLFKSQALARDLLASTFSKAEQKLELLRDQGKIPNTTIPVLEDRLASDTCICGETLDGANPEGLRRRQHIEKLIDNSRKADEIQQTITSLYFGSKDLLTPASKGENDWLSEYKEVVEKRDRLQILREEAGKRLKAIELKIDSLPDTDIQVLRETKRQYLSQRDRFSGQASSLETQLIQLRREQTENSDKRDRMLREQEKGNRILSELEVIQDVTRVLRASYDQITDEELNKVSDLMNKIFLEMIGADPEQGAIIRRAEISPEFDIIVYGPNERTLNPDRDLNGASRRALTLAFILSLTCVSEVEAPNIIDTPLGMMSGYVKRSVLKTAIRESSQLVLLLTRSEIAGCEEIIDEAAGAVITLTNPAHYPRMLVNNPGIDERKILRCGCNHRQECTLCQRHLDEDIREAS